MKDKFNLRKFRTNSSLMISQSEFVNFVAKDAMIKPVFLYPDDNAKKIIKKLKKENTNVCIVVTKEKKFLGEISNEDLIRFFINQINNEPLTEKLNVGYRKEFLFKSAKELVNRHKSTVDKNTKINDVIKLIYAEGFHYIPVLDINKKVIGVVTPSSVLNLLQEN